jgi:prevent-host-death family protein
MIERSIPASEFKAKCLALLDEVAEKKETLVVTKRGRPVARVVPAEEPRSLIDSVTYHISDEELVRWSADWEDDRELTRDDPGE